MVENMEAKATAREPQVHHEIVELGAAVDVLGATISTLVGKVTPVVQPAPPTQSEVEDTAEALVPVAAEIREQRWRVEELSQTLINLMGRLEI
jgi:hypothetical protein